VSAATGLPVLHTADGDADRPFNPEDIPMRTNDDYRATNPADEQLGPDPEERQPAIITRFVYPPIPIRSFDWSAVEEDYDEGRPTGWGATEAEACRQIRTNQRVIDMHSLAENPRAIIGGNEPPDALTLAESSVQQLRDWLKDNPVVASEDEARSAKLILDRVTGSLKDVEAERRFKVDPLNAEVKSINGRYHKLHNSDASRPGLWDRLLLEIRLRLTAYARRLEQERRAAAEAARRAAEEKARAAAEAAKALQEAQEAASMGVCEDIAEAVERAQSSASVATKADWTANRAEHQTKVRIGGGLGKVSTLRTVETLVVASWREALEDMANDAGRVPMNVEDAILTSARSFRKALGELPAGIQATFTREI
jgi:hypothetical protein